MGTLKDSKISSDRKKWQKTFNNLAQLLRTQYTQIESFLKERKHLEDRIKLQYDQISQMKRDFIVEEETRVVEAAKSDLLMSMKQREAFLSKLKLEDASADLEDFKQWIDCLSHKCSEQSDILKLSNSKDEGRRCKALESEVRRLKSENEKLVSNNNSEVSALLSEKKFVWNQYNKMERERTEQLRTKCAEVEQANEKIQNLLTGMEKLQSSINEKDNTIVKLKNKVAELEADSIGRREETARVSRELGLLRKSTNDLGTPVLRSCKSERASRSGGKNSVTVKKESHPSRVPELVKDTEKGSTSSKRKALTSGLISETPKLFSSTFKVPKLKNPSPCVT